MEETNDYKFLEDKSGEWIKQFLEEQNSESRKKYIDFLLNQIVSSSRDDGFPNLDEFERNNSIMHEIASYIDYKDSDQMKLFIDCCNKYPGGMWNLFSKIPSEDTKQVFDLFLDSQNPSIIADAFMAANKKDISYEAMYDKILQFDPDKIPYENYKKIGFDMERYISRGVMNGIVEIDDKNKQKEFFDKTIISISVMYNTESMVGNELFYTQLLNFVNRMDKTIIMDSILNYPITDFLYDFIYQRALKKPEKYQNIIEAVESLKLIVPPSFLDNYEEAAKNGVQLDENAFKDLNKQMTIYRKRNQILPEMYCDYYLKQILMLDFDSLENLGFQPMLYFSIIDKTRHILQKNGIEDYSVELGEKPSYFKNNILGFQDEKRKKIFFEQNSILVLKLQKNIQIIDTMFHEIEHAIQYNNIAIGNIGPKEYKFIKEECINQIDKNYYDRNYNNFYMEVDARIAAKQNQYKYLAQLGFTDKQILELDVALDQELYQTANEYIKEEEKLLSSDAQRSDSVGESTTFNKIFATQVLEHPEWLEKYPILYIEFDEKGSRKSSISILDAYESYSNNAIGENDLQISSKIDLFLDILNSSLDYDQEIINNIVLKDSKDILDYEPKTIEAKEFRNQIIEQELLANFEKYKISGQIDIGISEEESRKNFEEFVNNLHAFSQKYPNEEISLKIITQLQEYFDKSITADSDKSSNTENILNVMAKIDSQVTPKDRKRTVDAIKRIKNQTNELIIDDLTEDVSKE